MTVCVPATKHLYQSGSGEFAAAVLTGCSGKSSPHNLFTLTLNASLISTA